MRNTKTVTKTTVKKTTTLQVEPSGLNKDLSGISDYIRDIKDDATDEIPSKESTLRRSLSPPIKQVDEEKKSQVGGSPKPSLKKQQSIVGSEKESQRPASAKLAYTNISKRKPTGKDEGEVVFQVKDLEKDNLALKEKENLLCREIIKMQTKLRRIEELMRSGKNLTDGDFLALQNDLEDQFNQIKDENEILKDRVRKLRMIQKGLSTKEFGKNKAKFAKSWKPTVIKEPDHYSKCPYHYSSPHRHSHTQSPHGLSDDLRAQLVKIEKEVMRLKAEKDRLAGVSTGSIHADDLMRKIRERDTEIRDISKQFEDLESGFINKERIFKESKVYMEELLRQIREQRINNETLKQKNLSLQIRAQQANNLNDQLKSLEKERYQIEKSIRTITSEPFFKREKGESTLKRIADLEEKLAEKQKILRARKEEDKDKNLELTALKSAVEKLKGEKEYLGQENEKLKGKFSTENPVNDWNIHKTLFKMDPQRYGQAVGDIVYGQDNVPIWANLDFLERGQEDIDPNNIRELKAEILKIKHENKDFAAELEKAQNLLQLQKDIEKDNTQYYEAEKRRLELLMKSSSMKAEELARRADDKQRQINDTNKKFGLYESRASSHDKSQRPNLDMIETQSEFSALTNESDIRTDENVFDFVIQDAEYYFETFKQVLDAKELTLHTKTLITFATIDFYNHNTETSQVAEGYRPIYNTQFSFKNKIDDFYVQYLQKQAIKLDFYISKNNAAIHIGHARILLREIIERETAVQDANYKTQIIQRTIRIYPITGNQEQPIGSIRFKMRMRKPISEAMRFYREKNEIANMTALNACSEGELKTRRKMITIQIMGAQDVKVKYSSISKIAPFFYYQFYTFDERYSATSTGENPIFNDTQSYEVLFDAKLINYISKEPLEIILFDDNAPVTGVEKGGKALAQEQQIDDMIGTTTIPLENLIRGASIHEKFPIRNLKRENCGLLEVKVTVMDMDLGRTSIANQRISQMLTYNKQWENDIIYRIAQKLAKFPADVELLFGIFSRGQKTVSKEDFKYCCLQRLGLKKEISEREMDIFLTGCPVLADKEYIDKNDFIMIFSSFITQARNELQNNEAMQYSTVKRHDDLQKSMTGRQMEQYNEFSRSGSPEKGFYSSMNNLNDMDMMEILSKIKDYGSVDQLLEKMRMYSVNDQMMSKDFIATLISHGSISEQESRKVCAYIEVQNKVSVSKFQELLERAIQQATLRSQALKKFIDTIKTKGDILAAKCISLDLNRDGQLNIDGLTAALLSDEFMYKVDEAKEIFNLVKRGEMFFYRDYLTLINPSLRAIMLSRSPTNTRNQSLVDMSKSMQQDSLSQSSILDDPRLKTIKAKLKDYIQANDITLTSLFQIIDSNSNQLLSLAEFMVKMKSLFVPLDDDELRFMFKVLDRSGTGSITYKQFVSEFPEINVAYLINKIRKIIIGSKVAPEMLFDKYCSDKKNMLMIQSDFKQFVKQFVDRAVDHEIDSLFRHFDYQNRGHITKQEFISAFGRDISEQVFRVSIEDIIKPLASKILAFKVNISKLFDAYDQNNNGRLSGEELAKALILDQKIVLDTEEVQMIKQYFQNKHNSMEIKKMDFIDLINTKFERHFDTEEAKQSLTTLKQKLISLNQSTSQMLSPYDTEGTGKVTLRNFKIGINKVHALNQYSIDNLAKYLDKENTGFISINEVDVALRQQVVPLSSTGSFSQSSFSKKRMEKWK